MSHKSQIFLFQTRDIKKKTFSRLLFLFFLYLVFSVQQFQPALAEQLKSYWGLFLILFLLHIIVSYFKILKLAKSKIVIENQILNYSYSMKINKNIPISEIQEIRSPRPNNNTIVIIGKNSRLTLSYLEKVDLFKDELCKINREIIIKNSISKNDLSKKEKLPFIVSLSLLPSIVVAILHFVAILNAVYFFLFIFANISTSFLSYYFYLYKIDKKDLFLPYKRIFIVSSLFLVLALIYFVQIIIRTGSIP